MDIDNVLEAEPALAILRNLFTQADTDGSGYLDKAELAVVVRNFYKEEKMSRNIKVVTAEVDDAMSRFDANGDGVLQFEEFVDMLCLSESFKFKIPLETKLRVKVLLASEMEEARQAKVMEERELVWQDATRLERVKVRHLETQVEALTESVDDKVLQIRTLEDELQKSQTLLRTSEGRLKEALNEVERLYRNKIQVPNLSIPEDEIAFITSGSPALTAESISLSPRTPGGRQGGNTPRSPHSCRSVTQSPRSAPHLRMKASPTIE